MTTTPNRRRDWLMFLLPLILSPFYLGGIVWILQPRIVEGIVSAVQSPTGQIAACGLPDCAAVPTRLSTLAVRIDTLEGFYTTSLEASACNSMPQRVEVENGAAGDWVTLSIFGVCRIRPGCGAPTLTPAIINGDGRFHSMETAFEGYPLTDGDCRDFSFPVRIPENVHSGLGNVLLGITYPNANPPAPNQSFGPASLIIGEVDDDQG